MPSVPSMSFNVRFDLASAPTLVLTDATTYPVGAIGIFTITQPDGYVRTGNFSSPDISSSGGTLSTSLRLSSTGGVQCGTYNIKYEIRTTDLVISTFTREFVFTYAPVELKLKENFDVFTPSLSYSDMTLYGVNNYTNTSPTRAWSAVSTPTGTKTSTASSISLQHNGEYYDAVYTITLASTLTYQHTTYSWLSVLETVSKTVVAEACTPKPLEDLIAMMETLRQNSINCAGDLPVFEKAQSLFSHLMDQVKMVLLNNIPQDGIYDTSEDLMAILMNGQPCVHTNLPIDPYDLGDYAVSPFPLDLSYCDLIGDGYNTTYTVNHNLNDDCVIVQVYESATGAQVLCDITVSNNNSVDVSFYTAPTTDQYKVVVYAGAKGQVGPGVAAGGGIGQFLVKGSLADYDTQWITPSFATNTRTLTINGVGYDLTQDRSWAVDNLYTNNGALTSNRIVTINDKQLVFKSNQSTLQNYTFTTGTPTGVPVVTWPSSVVFDGEYLMSTANAEPYNTRVWARNQSNGTRSFWVNQVYTDITGESTGETRILNQYYSTARGSVLDTSTATTAIMRGVWSQIGHKYIGDQSTTATISTNFQDAFLAQTLNYTGNISNVTAFSASNSTGYNGTPYTTNITNYYGFYQATTINDSKSTITNHYGLFLNTPSGTGTITNRWGVYAPDVAMRHYLNGNLLLGSTSDTGLYKLDVTGAARISERLTLGEQVSYTSTDFRINDSAFTRLRFATGVTQINNQNAQVLTFQGVSSGGPTIKFENLQAGSSSADISTMQIYPEYSGFIGTTGRIHSVLELYATGNPAVGTPGLRYLYINPSTTGFGFTRAIESVSGDVLLGTASGNVGIGATTSINTSAILQVTSTTKGFLPPRMTEAQKNAISSPASGLIIYQTDGVEGLYIRTSSTWRTLIMA